MNYEVLIKTYIICLRQTKTYGALFELSKYELIYLTRRLKGKNIKATIKINGFEKELNVLIRVLGLYIDGKLRYREYLQQYKVNIVSQKRVLQYLIQSIQEVIFYSYRTVYQTVIVPAITFATAVQYSPKNFLGAREKYTRELTKIQNRSL